MSQINSRSHRLLWIIFLFFALCLPMRGFAAVNLSVNPLEGGTSLRLGHVGSSNWTDKTVKIRITSTDNVQYQVYQRLIEPLTNEQGTSLNSDAIKSYTVSGSNAQGTIYVQSPESLTQTDQLLYTSPADGLSDSFDVAYAIRPERLNVSGQFTGKIMYTLRSLGSGGQDQVILNVTMDAKGELKVELEGTSGRNLLKLSSKDAGHTSEQIKIKINDNHAGAVKVTQELDVPVQNELFEQLSSDLLQFSLNSDGPGQKLATSGQLQKRSQALYETQAANDALYINWTLEPTVLAKQKAGQYTGRLKYTIESNGIIQDEILVDVEIQIEPQFTIEVTLPPEGMRFEKVLPESPAQVKEVFVEVKTNLGKPYMVIQNMVSPMTNIKGNEIAGQHFHMKVTLEPDRKGRAAFEDFQEVKPGEVSIFYSDNQGSSASFRAYYRLRGYPEIVAGDYSTSIVYSLSEM